MKPSTKKVQPVTAVDNLIKEIEISQGFNVPFEIKERAKALFKTQIVMAYMGYYNPNISAEDFESLKKEAEHYFKLKYEKRWD